MRFYIVLFFLFLSGCAAKRICDPIHDRDISSVMTCDYQTVVIKAQNDVNIAQQNQQLLTIQAADTAYEKQLTQRELQKVKNQLATLETELSVLERKLSFSKNKNRNLKLKLAAIKKETLLIKKTNMGSIEDKKK